MSGGSHNYLFAADLDGPHDADLDRMADDLAELGFAVLAEETRSFMQTKKPGGALREAWHAVEWWKSNDYSKAQAYNEIVTAFFGPDTDIREVALAKAENVADTARGRRVRIAPSREA